MSILFHLVENGLASTCKMERGTISPCIFISLLPPLGFTDNAQITRYSNTTTFLLLSTHSQWSDWAKNQPPSSLTIELIHDRWIKGNPYRGGVSDISGSLETLGNQQVCVWIIFLYQNTFWAGAHPLWEALPKETQCRLWGLLYIWIQAHHRHLLQRQRHLWDGFQRASIWPEHTV